MQLRELLERKDIALLISNGLGVITESNFPFMVIGNLASCVDV